MPSLKTLVLLVRVSAPAAYWAAPEKLRLFKLSDNNISLKMPGRTRKNNEDENPAKNTKKLWIEECGENMERTNRNTPENCDSSSDQVSTIYFPLF